MPYASVHDAEISGVKTLMPKRHGDERGWFSESWTQKALAQAGIEAEFVQDNVSYSKPRGTIRGLHFQAPPHDIGKLVYVLSGAVLDVAVDLRKSSPHFGAHVAFELNADEGLQVWVPPGFAHGFCTLTPDCLVCYKQTGYYDPEADRGVLWNDPALAIDWPVVSSGAVLSPRDEALPRLAELPDFFD